MVENRACSRLNARTHACTHADRVAVADKEKENAREERRGKSNDRPDHALSERRPAARRRRIVPRAVNPICERPPAC